MSTVPWLINPPTSLNDLHTLAKLPGEYSDVKTAYLDPHIISTHTDYWFPEMQGWRVKYGSGGLSAAQQVWIAPWGMPAVGADMFVTLPMCIRQLTSWNRERYTVLTSKNCFWDLDWKVSDRRPWNLQRPLVVTDVEVIPRNDIVDSNSERLKAFRDGESTFGFMGSTGQGVIEGWDRNDYTYMDYVKYVQDALRFKGQEGLDGLFKKYDRFFPRMCSQYWQINLTWEPDPYVNRWGIRYAKVEVLPALRLESLKNVPAGVVPTKTDGQPEFELVDSDYTVDANATPPKMGDPTLIDPLTTGFPMREPQITFKISYPWVSLTNLLDAGPIGNPNQFNDGSSAVVQPQNIPPGLYIGCVNKKSFLGYPRGRVLYNSAELSEETSPITGKIGYKITHEFIVNPTMEWNQTRYSGKYNPLEFQVPATDGNIMQPRMNTAADGFDEMVTSPWRTGFITQMEGRSGFQKVYRVAFNPAGANDAARNWQAVYPYPYKDLNDLLYYGMVGSTDKFNPSDTIEG